MNKIMQISFELQVALTVIACAMVTVALFIIATNVDPQHAHTHTQPRTACELAERRWRELQ